MTVPESMDAAENRCHFAMIENLSIVMAASCCLHFSLTTKVVVYSFPLAYFEMRAQNADCHWKR